MSKDLSPTWVELERQYAHFLDQLEKFLSADPRERIRLLQDKYESNPRLVVEILEKLNPQELKELLPLLIEHVRSVHGYLQSLRRVIMLLPKDWLVRNIDEAVEPWLQTGDDEYFRRFLELYILIDRPLTRRLAERAVRSDNVDIREAGEDFLQLLERDA